MLKENKWKAVTLLLLIAIVSSQSCLQYTEPSCMANSCRWNNGTCTNTIQTCLSGQVYSNNNNICTSCSSLASNQCSSLCTNFYFSTTCKPCTDIDQNCIQCSNSTECTKCASNFILSDLKTQCNAGPCNISQCTQCGGNNYCFSCKTGYAASSDGSSCELATCSIESCFSCLNSAACSRCLSGYSLSTDSTKCRLICNDPNCASCQTADGCSTCKDGFAYSSTLGLCKMICLIPTCSECDLVNTCRVCQSGYQPNAEYSDCIPICTDTNCASCATPTICTRCNVGFNLNTAGVCSRTICQMKGCSTCLTVTTCLACSTGYTAINSTFCQGNCITSTNNCIECSSDTKCSACQPGYKLSSDSTSCVSICSISNCAMCENSYACKFCATGYISNSDSSACILNCGILNCLSCNSTTTCGTFVSPYISLQGGRASGLACSKGLFLSSSGACTLCSASVANCDTCVLESTSSKVLCNQCLQGFYLTGSGTCSSCSAISNCASCISPTECISCNSGFNIVYSASTGYTCASPPQCSVTNCKQCVSSNSAKCDTCNDGFVKSTDGTVCNSVVCIDTQVYNPITLTCGCPTGFYLSQKKCKACKINKCVSCDTAGCSTCMAGYYPSLGKCQKCISNCINCSAANSCLECDDDYKFSNGKCVKNKVGRGDDDDGSNTLCPGGCQSCTIKNKVLVSCVPADGYSIDSNGNVVRCDYPCKTCSRSSPSKCTSCFGASFLTGNTCGGCTDLFASSCSSDLQYSITCVSGYSPFNGVCKACSADCLTCGNAGPGLCDTCKEGFVVIDLTQNCTQCYKACGTCSSVNPGICLSCASGDYLDTTLSVCLNCPATCATCTSATACTSCVPNYVLSNNQCFAVLAFPCSAQTGNTCTACYSGYTLTGGSCVSQGCNTTKTCLGCQPSEYLKNSQCFSCQTDSTSCLYCQVTDPKKCVTCKNTYYVNSAKSCSLCSSSLTGCSECYSGSYCTVATDGYYIVKDVRGRSKGEVGKCRSSCLTCSNSQSCNICQTGYNKVGTRCIFNKNVQATFVLQSGAGTPWFQNDTINTVDNNTMLAFGFLKSNQVQNALAIFSGVNFQNVLIVSLSWGSLIANTIIEADPTSDPNLIVSNINTNTKNANITDFRLLSSSMTPSFSTSSSSVNLGLILGLTIPLVILLVFLAVLCKILYIGAKDDKDDNTTEETNKQIVDADL